MAEPSNQAEHQQISTALEVEQIEVNFFRSKSLWLPARARGVFGGQVISQALVSATNCVNSAFALHSLHCYFLLAGSPATPIVYQVEPVRRGKSYCTLSVKAVQNGKIIFVMMCSFQKPEPWQPTYQWPMPKVPKPEDCELEEDRFNRLIKTENPSNGLRKLFEDTIFERSRSPIAIKQALVHDVGTDGSITYAYWMKARDIPKYDTPFQKCILGYMSDLHFISSVPRIMGMPRGRAPDAIGMTSTLDHTIYYYSNDFDCGDWLLYVMSAPRAGSGRAVIHGRMYSRDGSLVAVTSQEGVVRSNRKGPEVEAKL